MMPKFEANFEEQLITPNQTCKYNYIALIIHWTNPSDTWKPRFKEVLSVNQKKKCHFFDENQNGKIKTAEKKKLYK